MSRGAYKYTCVYMQGRGGCNELSHQHASPWEKAASAATPPASAAYARTCERAVGMQPAGAAGNTLAAASPPALL